MYTLDKMLDMISKNLSYWHPITLKSKKGKKLEFSRLSWGDALHVVCEKPGKKTRQRFLDLDKAGHWKQCFASIFKLKLDVPCWTIPEDVIRDIDCAIKEIQRMKDAWETLNEEDKAKPNEGAEQLVLDCCKE